jgi:hypothetical protein
MNVLAPVPPVMKKKRRWWVYLLIAFGGLIILGVVTVVGLFLYGQSLLRHYTSTTPKVLPKIEYDAQRWKQLEARWDEFSKALLSRQDPPPFVLTKEDLDLFVARDKGLRNNVRLVLTNGQVQADFSFPMGTGAPGPLKGRYLNGTAGINLVFDNGWLDVTLGKVEANGQPIPGWILKRFQRETGNLVKQFDRDRKTVNLLHELASIRVQDDQIVLTPIPSGR